METSPRRPIEAGSQRQPAILVVDDDESFRASVTEALAQDGYLVHAAADGVEALATLEAESVDLVLTDVKMPRLDGVALAEALVNRHGVLPCLVMTAFSTPELERRVSRVGALRVVQKPVDLGALREAIREALDQRQEGGTFRGINVASFLQLLAVERMTCTVKVTSARGAGLLFFRAGELWDATTGPLDGPEACFEILGWPTPELAVHSGSPASGRRTIQESLEGILLESMRMQDESVLAGHAARTVEKEVVMALEKHLEEMKGIKGYMASGILNYTGEALAVHSGSDSVRLDAVAAVFNDVFRGAHEASTKIGLEAARVMTLQTPKGIVQMACSGTTAAAHVHMIVVLEESGNQALARMTIDKTLPKVVAELA